MICRWLKLTDRRSTVYSWLLSNARTSVWFSRWRLSGQGVVLKKALDGKPCTIEAQTLHINVSHIVQFMKIETKYFSTSFGEKKHPKSRVDCLFFYFESLLRLFQ